MNYSGSYYSNSLYTSTAYSIADNLFKNITPSNNALRNSKVVALEVPKDAIGFTVYCESAEKSLIILSDRNEQELVNVINEKFIKMLNSIRNLQIVLGNVKFNIMGYLKVSGENAYSWFYDIYINDNWIDYPAFLKIIELKEVDLKPLPEIYIGTYNDKLLREQLGSPSIFDFDKENKIEKMIVKNYLEPYSQTTRQGIGFFFEEKEVPKPTIIASNEVKSLVPVSTDIKDSKYLKVAKEIFDIYINQEEIVESLKDKKIIILDKNKLFVYNYIKTKILSIVFENWALLDDLNTCDIRELEKLMGHFSFSFCKETLNLFVIKNKA